MAACRAVHAIVVADVSTADAVASRHENGDATTAADISRENKRETAEDTVHLRLLPHLLALSNLALSLRLNSESILNLRRLWKLTIICLPGFLSAGSVSLSSQALAICMMQKDNQVSHSE